MDPGVGMSSSNHRGIARVSSAPKLVSPSDFASPLAQLSLNGESSYAGPSRRSREFATAPDVPPLKFNLFRTPSVYSTTSESSFDSLSTISADEIAFNTIGPDGIADVLDNGEGPSTPRATVHDQADYFSGQLTPRKASSQVSLREPNGDGTAYRGDGVAKIVTHPAPALVTAEEVYIDDTDSIHGEQGSEWGDDEAEFEWLDTTNAPAAENGGETERNFQQGAQLGGRIKSMVRRTNSTRVAPPSSESVQKPRKNLVFPRRAAPPPPVDTPSAPPSHFSPNPSMSSFPSPNPSYPSNSPREGELDRQSVLLPRPNIPPRSWTEGTMRNGLKPADLFIPPPRENRGPPNISPTVPSFRSNTPELRSNASSKDLSRISSQPAAYPSHDPSSSRSHGPSPTLTGREFPNGANSSHVPHERYLSKEQVQARGRSATLTERSVSKASGDRPSKGAEDEHGTSSEELVVRGIEERGKGDLPKSAWYFMRAAEGGSATGRMYWGLALRHGWGVAKDDRRAFAELRQACDESLAGGGLNFHQSPGAAQLTLSQKKALARDLSLGMFEIANCFLDGVGVKKAPSIALSYLRFAGNLGDIAAQERFVLSKGGNGVKKDMWASLEISAEDRKEAAKWYRMAISQGSTNTFGLAWVWKEKYM